MEKFNIIENCKNATSRQVELREINGWTHAYRDVDGIQSYKEGLIEGGNNCYIEAIYDIKRFICKLTHENSDLKASELIDLIYEPKSNAKIK